MLLILFFTITTLMGGGGQLLKAKRSDFPSMVNLKKSLRKRPYCAGLILDPGHVLTSASCKVKRRSLVTYGAVQDYKAGEVTRAVNYWLHPKAKKYKIRKTKGTVYRGFGKSIWYRSMKILTIKPHMETCSFCFDEKLEVK